MKFRGLISRLLNRGNGKFNYNTSVIFGSDYNFGDYTVMSIANEENKEIKLTNGETTKHAYIQIVDNKLNISRYFFDDPKVVGIVNAHLKANSLHFQEQN